MNAPTRKPVFLMLLTAAMLISASAWGNDSTTFWNTLSPADRAAIQRTLEEKLPALFPAEGANYARALAQGVPLWLGHTGDLKDWADFWSRLPQKNSNDELDRLYEIHGRIRQDAKDSHAAIDDKHEAEQRFR